MTECLNCEQSESYNESYKRWKSRMGAVKGRPHKYLNLRRAGLFVAEGDDGVDAGGAASGDGCGEDRGSS